jgi:hypothetical protein
VPSLPLPWIKRFVCYGKIRTTQERMIRLFNEFEFWTVREALLSLDIKIPNTNI